MPQYQNNIVNAIQRIIKALENSKGQFPTFIQWLEDRLSIWSQPNWRVGMIGVTSSGKSTLINALLGDKLLPSGVRPSSNTLVMCAHGDRKEAVVHFENSSKASHIHQSIAENLSRYSDEAHNPGNTYGVAQIDLYCPDFLPGKGISLVDTPGLDAHGYDSHETLTMKTFMPTIDLAIFVTTAKANADQQVVSYLADIAHAGKPIILVQNMVDTIEPKLGAGGSVERSREDVARQHLDRLRNISREAFGDLRHQVIQVSAMRALENDLQGSGLTDLCENLRFELQYLAPSMETGRKRQLIQELKTVIPKDENVPDDGYQKRRLTQIDQTFEHINAAQKKISGDFNAILNSHRSAKAQLFKDARDVSEQGAARRFFKRLENWQEILVQDIHKYVQSVSDEIARIAAILNLPEREYRMQGLMRSNRPDDFSVPTSVQENRTVRERRGFFSGVARFFGVGGYEVVYEKKTVLDRIRFQEMVRTFATGEVSWAEGCQSGLGVLHTWLKQLGEEANRQKQMCRESLQVWQSIHERQKVRAALVPILAELQKDNPTVQGGPNEIRKARYAWDGRCLIKTHRSVLDCLRLGALIAGCRFTAARDACLKRAGKTFAKTIILGWDADALHRFLSRFWSDNVRYPDHLLSKGCNPEQSIIVGQMGSKKGRPELPGAYHTADTAVFLLLDAEQPGATQSALARATEILEWLKPCKDMILCMQSARAFKRSGKLDQASFAEAVGTLIQATAAFNLTWRGMLVNDDDIALSVIADVLLCQPPLHLSDERAVIRSLSGVADENVVAGVLREWRILFHADQK